MKTIQCLFLAALLMGAGFLHAAAGGTCNLPEPVCRVKNGIGVTVHPQVELISIVQSIGNYSSLLGFLMSDASFEYKAEVNQRFSAFRHHPAVKMFDRLSAQPRMLNFSVPSNIMLYTDSCLELRTDIVLDDFVVGRAGGKDSLVVFLELLRDFATRTAFDTFYNEHRGFYLKLIGKTLDSMGDFNYVAELESFYGKQQRSYTLVLVALYNHVGFGNSLLHADGRRDLYNTMGPVAVEGEVPFFGDSVYLKYMVRHEFSHPFVNPLTEKFWDSVKSYASRYDSIPEVARRQVCGDWQECINEFVIRAVTTYLAYRETQEAGSWAYHKEKDRGVTYLDPLLDNIKLYQSDRETWPTFESGYSLMLGVFKE